VMGVEVEVEEGRIPPPLEEIGGETLSSSMSF